MDADAHAGPSGAHAGGAVDAAASAAVDAKLVRCAALKAEGNALFAEGKNGEAVFKWFELIALLTSLDRARALAAVGNGAGGAMPDLMGGGNSSGLSESQLAEVNALTLSAHLNMAAALLKVRG